MGVTGGGDSGGCKWQPEDCSRVKAGIRGKESSGLSNKKVLGLRNWFLRSSCWLSGVVRTLLKVSRFLFHHELGPLHVENLGPVNEMGNGRK